MGYFAEKGNGTASHLCVDAAFLRPLSTCCERRGRCSCLWELGTSSSRGKYKHGDPDLLMLLFPLPNVKGQRERARLRSSFQGTQSHSLLAACKSEPAPTDLCQEPQPGLLVHLQPAVEVAALIALGDPGICVRKSRLV